MGKNPQVGKGALKVKLIPLP